MKKLVALLLSVFAIACSVNVFAEEGFVSSPVGGQGPAIITGIISNPDCDAHIVVTPYSQRNGLPSHALAAIEAAFDDISATEDLSALNADFASLVASLGLVGGELAVSDLFDLSYVGCTIHDSHGLYNISLSADNLSNFVGLLHCNDGVWQLVDNASADDGVLNFSVSALSPFAIIVKTEGASQKFLYGDVNFDGTVNSLDAAQVLKQDAQLVSFEELALAVGDVSGDGRVNSLDAAQILKYDARLISVFPAGTWYIQES